MIQGELPARYKRLSVLRRVPHLGCAHWLGVPGLEGYVGVFEMPIETAPVIVEAEAGRSMALVPGDVFLATPGYRESVHWTVGGIPDGGLIPGENYGLLAESGVVGALTEASPAARAYFGNVRYLGAVVGTDGKPLRLQDFAMRTGPDASDAGAPVYLLLGTSVEVGKTTAGLTLLRTLLDKGHRNVVVLKATGTTSIAEAAVYSDFGANRVFDCLDFGIPATFPCGRPDAQEVFRLALDVCLSLDADAVVIECGGDLLGTCVPEFLQCLVSRRPNPTAILAAFDPSGALGAKRILDEKGVRISLITGPCTDTSVSRQRTQDLCGVPARNMRSAIPAT